MSGQAIRQAFMAIAIATAGITAPIFFGSGGSAARAASPAATPPAAQTPAEPVPAWAFPGPLNKSVPGSKLAWSDVQMFDRAIAVEWFPEEHPAMPASVKGRMPLYACGYCHLPEGAGRPESAPLAGLPYEYLLQQAADMRSGARVLPDPSYFAGINMLLTIKHPQLTQQDIDDAARYYSSLKFIKHTRVIEAADIPAVTTNAFVYVFDETGKREPLGERIIEGPDDFERFERRDPHTTFTAYVPVGSIARGAALAKGNGSTRLSCESCHGEGLKGGALGPPIAGRPVTPQFRQLYAFKKGTRNGAGALLMHPVVADLSQRDMIDLAAYVGSLEP